MKSVITYGTTGGWVASVKASSRVVRPLWSAQGCGEAESGAVVSLQLQDMTLDGIEELVVGYEEGKVYIFLLPDLSIVPEPELLKASLGSPPLLYTSSLDEQLSAAVAGVVGSTQQTPEVVLATRSGKLFGLIRVLHASPTDFGDPNTPTSAAQLRILNSIALPPVAFDAPHAADLLRVGFRRAPQTSPESRLKISPDAPLQHQQDINDALDDRAQALAREIDLLSNLLIQHAPASLSPAPNALTSLQTQQPPLSSKSKSTFGFVWPKLPSPQPTPSNPIPSSVVQVAPAQDESNTMNSSFSSTHSSNPDKRKSNRFWRRNNQPESKSDPHSNPQSNQQPRQQTVIMQDIDDIPSTPLEMSLNIKNEPILTQPPAKQKSILNVFAKDTTPSSPVQQQENTTIIRPSSPKALNQCHSQTPLSQPSQPQISPTQVQDKVQI
jgi:hypothetical protein